MRTSRIGVRGRLARTACTVSVSTPPAVRMRVRLRSERLTKCSPPSMTHGPCAQRAQYSMSGR